MSVANSEAWKNYSNQILGISIDYPQKWSFEESPSMGIVMFADEKTLKSQNPTPTAPVANLLVQKIPGITLDDFSEQQVLRMREMTGDNIKVEKNAFFGDIPAHKAVSVLNMPGMSMKFFSLWAYQNGIGYSLFFHSAATEYNALGPSLTHMIKSFKTTKIVELSYPLESYNQHGVVLRYPAGWKATKRAADDEKSPLITLTNEELDGTTKLTTTVRLLSTQKKGPLSTHVDLLKVQLEKMHVEKVDLLTTNVGSKEARVASWMSDASGVPTRYMHMMTTENDSETSPVFALTLMTTSPVGEYDQIPSIFHQLRSSFIFTSESKAVSDIAAWGGYYHLKFKFGFLFDTKHYQYRQEGIPLTEASFSRIGDDPTNPLVNFSVIVREMDPKETPDLIAMGEELEKNLRGVCGNSLQTIASEETTISGLPGRVIIFFGTAASPMNPEEVEEMYFAYKYVLNSHTSTALLFAFASAPKFWKEEWKLVETYLDTLYWASSE